MPDDVVVKTAETPSQGAANGGSAAESGVPKDLEKFKGADGKLDLVKLSQGYLDSEKKATQEAQKRAEAERAYSIAITGFGDTGREVPGAGVADGRGSGTGAGVDDDEPVTNKSAKPVVQTLLVLAHPELELDPSTNEPKNPKFYDGLLTYMKGLPVSIRTAIRNGDFQMTEWAVREYKALTKTRASASSGGGEGTKPNFVEGGGPSSGASAGPSYSRSEMKKMMLQSPSEYAKLSDDYGKAIAEGRVKE
jgi:hypothetical protein